MTVHRVRSHGRRGLGRRRVAVSVGAGVVVGDGTIETWRRAAIGVGNGARIDLDGATPQVNEPIGRFDEEPPSAARGSSMFQTRLPSRTPARYISRGSPRTFATPPSGVTCQSSNDGQPERRGHAADHRRTRSNRRRAPAGSGSASIRSPEARNAVTRLQRRVRRSKRHRLSSPSSSVLSNPGSISPTTATTVSAEVKTGENTAMAPAGAAIEVVEPSTGDQIRRLEPSDQTSFPSGDHAGWLASPGWSSRMTRSGVRMTTASGPASSSTYAVPEPAFVATWRTTPAFASTANARLSPVPSSTTSVRPPTTAARPEPRAATVSEPSAGHALGRACGRASAPDRTPCPRRRR